MGRDPGNRNGPAARPPRLTHAWSSSSLIQGLDMLHGALVTFRRPSDLASFLDSIGRQTRRLDHLVVVDCDPEGSGWPPLKAHLAATSGTPKAAADVIDYLPQDANLGAAGGWSVGQTFLAQGADDDDWIMMLDDDDPPRRETVLEEREEFAEAMLSRDPMTAAVGGVGAMFDRRRGRLRRLGDAELDGPVRVDYVGSGHFPLYRVGVMRELGPFLPELFLGYTELEYALRVHEAALPMYVDGDAILAKRSGAGTLGRPGRSRSRMVTSMPPWRVYYTTRNMVWMLRVTGHRTGALRVSVRRGLGRGLSQLLVSPRQAPRYLRAGWRGIRHGWSDVLGRVIDPDDPTLTVHADRIVRRDRLMREPIEAS